MNKLKVILIHHLGSRKNARPDQIAKYLVKRGHEVHLILWDVPYPFGLFIKNFFKSLRYIEYEADGVFIHKVRRLPFFCPPINRRLFQRQIKRIFKEEKIDMIISESYINEMEPPVELPIIYSLVDDFESYASLYGSKLYKLSFRILEVKKTIENQMRRAKAVIVVSDILIKYAKKYNNKVFKITNGVEPWVLDGRYTKRKYNYGKHSLVYVSGFDYWSNLPSLLEAVAEVKKHIPDIRVVLVGNGYQIPIAKKITKNLSLEENIIFLGWVNNRRELFEIVNSCNVCLNLSEKNRRQDSANPLKVFEYSALAKPVISTRLREVEVLNFPNVLFYKDKNKESLVKAINKSFRLRIDKTKVRKLISKYSWDNIIKEFETVIENAKADLSN